MTRAFCLGARLPSPSPFIKSRPKRPKLTLPPFPSLRTLSTTMEVCTFPAHLQRSLHADGLASFCALLCFLSCHERVPFSRPDSHRALRVRCVLLSSSTFSRLRLLKLTSLISRLCRLGPVVPLLPILRWRGIQSRCASLLIQPRSRPSTCTSSLVFTRVQTDISWPFPFCPFAHLKLARHEHYLSANIGLKAGMKVLDVGCGVGGPAREIARFSDATIVGLVRSSLSFRISFLKTPTH